mgnify:CR=1 FL=1
MNTEIILRISSQIVASNIDDVAASVRAEVAKVNTDLKTDEDFATAEQQVKDFKNAEDAIKEARDAALSEAQDVRKLLDTTSEIIDLLADTRLALDKQVKAQKAKVKEEIIGVARDGIHRALAGCDARLQPAMRKVLRIDELDGVLTEATKGKKSLAGLEKAAHEVLANWTALIGKTEAYMKARYAQIPAGRLHLFADLDDLLALDSGFEDAIAARIAAEDERQGKARADAEAELRNKIAAEEQAETQTAPEPQTMPETGEPVLEYIITIKMNTTLTNAKAVATNLKNSLRADIKLCRGA